MHRVVPLFAVAALAFPIDHRRSGARRHHWPGHHPRHPAAREQRDRDPDHRAARAGAVRGRRPGSRGPGPGQQTVGIDEALNNLPGVVVSNRYNFSSTSASRSAASAAAPISGPRASRSCWTGFPDPARRAEPAHQRGLCRPRPRRGAAGRELVALRQRIRWGDLASRPSAPRRAPSPSGCGCRAATASGRRRLLQVAELDLGPVRQRERDPLDLPVQGRRLPPAQRRRVPPAQRRGDWAMSGSTIGTLRLSLADNPEAQNPGALTGDRVRREPRFRRAEQHHPRARTRTPSNISSRSAASLRRGGQRVFKPRFRAAARPGEPASGSTGIGGAPPTAGTYVRIDRAVGGIPGSAWPAARRAAAGTLGSPPASTLSGCATTGRTSCPTPARPPPPSCWISGSR